MTDDMSLTPNNEPTKHSKWRSPKRLAVIGAVAAVVIVALGIAGIFFYANVLNDSPDELGASDLEAVFATTTAVADPADPATSDPVDPAATSVAPADPAADPAADPGAEGAVSYDGNWTVTAESQFGYRVEEVLAGVNTTAVGRSNQLTGSMTVDGTRVPAVDMEVQVATITSDESKRDESFRGSVMNTAEFPTATFHLTQPIELGAIPAEGEQITASATGDLTMHGVTQPVTFDVTAQASGGKIGVLGSIPILFTDYGIQNPS